MWMEAAPNQWPEAAAATALETSRLLIAPLLLLKRQQSQHQQQGNISSKATSAATAVETSRLLIAPVLLLNACLLCNAAHILHECGKASTSSCCFSPAQSLLRTQTCCWPFQLMVQPDAGGYP
jgi:hypothetical protein